MALCVRAWRDLSTCRSIGFGLGPLPWTAVTDWLDRSGLDAAAARVLRAVLVRLDNDFLEAQASRNAKG